MRLRRPQCDPTARWNATSARVIVPLPQASRRDMQFGIGRTALDRRFELTYGQGRLFCLCAPQALPTREPE